MRRRVCEFEFQTRLSLHLVEHADVIDEEGVAGLRGSESLRHWLVVRVAVALHLGGYQDEERDARDVAFDAPVFAAIDGEGVSAVIPENAEAVEGGGVKPLDVASGREPDIVLAVAAVEDVVQMSDAGAEALHDIDFDAGARRIEGRANGRALHPESAPPPGLLL